ncbi:hypothetical protein HB779_17285 [Phyllobacterium sp. 628]|uniref:PD-(D/E)XK nuclease-like domain-containing protein n=1 Tax=Phyllobacterium sp. 628 TaxID=2718938 RepID=UPI00166228C4|nr:PD-(D/E)XK nuclease-like domain-containing protein [Phyllobacterium sp. 628]QND53444.1 hypothetical protein HB779_17285 [Phyllobacterium sp. 628]
MNDIAVNPDIKPGIYGGIPNEAYHSGPGISKSGLWTIQTKTPAHYKFPPIVEETTQTKAVKDFGTGAHLAILEPELFEKLVVRGPDDRRGNKWTDLAEGCKLSGKLLLVSKAYDEILALRDSVHADPFINGIITGGKAMVEPSGYAIDPVTGCLCRVRPDLYREDLGIILDVKTTESAHPDAFARSVINYGYHAQEAFYSDIWASLNKPVNGWVFLTFEKKSPYAAAAYELPPSIVEEGRATMRQALDRYAECTKTNRWPAYGEGVQELTFKHWAYRLTDAPNALDEQQAEDAA